MGLLSALKLKSVPLTVSFSLIVLFSWLASYAGVRFLLPLLFFGGLLNATFIFFAALGIGVIFTSFLVRPFEGKFEIHKGQHKIEFIGSVGTINTGSISHKFGEVMIKGRSGIPVIYQARCDRENELKKGDEVLVISIDKSRKVFIVEPLGSRVAVAVEDRLRRFKAQAAKRRKKT